MGNSLLMGGKKSYLISNMSRTPSTKAAPFPGEVKVLGELRMLPAASTQSLMLTAALRAQFLFTENFLTWL